MNRLKTFTIRCLILLTHMIPTSVDVVSIKKPYYKPVGNGYCVIYEYEKKAVCININSIPNFDEGITRLEMDNNDILELTTTSFSHNNYTKINLAKNAISDIATETFSNLKKLKKVDLSNNKIFILNETIFENNIELDTLYLQDNPYLNFSAHKLPQSLMYLNLQNTSTFISLTNLKELKNLRTYKGNLCMDNNCTINLELEGTLLTHVTDIPQACVKETEEVVSTTTNCNNFSPESTSDNTNYKNMEKFLDHMNTLQDLPGSVENIYNQISKIENNFFNFNYSLYRINMSLAGLHNKVGDGIHKIYYHYWNITTELRKVALELSNLNNRQPHFVWLYILMFIIYVLVIILAFLIRNFYFQYLTSLDTIRQEIFQN